MKLLNAILVLAGSLSACALFAQAEPPVEVLGKSPVWRTFRQTSPVPVTRPIKPEKVVNGPNRELIDVRTTSAPPSDWAATDFDDQAWDFASDVAVPYHGAWQDIIDRRLTGSIQFRTRFGVGNPKTAEGLTLSLVYRGGVTVYVNGKEVGRSDMPAGAVDSTTPALDYPIDAFTGPEGQWPLAKEPDELKDEDPNTRFYKMRVRSAEIPIPAASLRAGTNVLAIQSSRSPRRQEALHFRKHQGVDPASAAWPTLGLISASLHAPASTGMKAAELPPVRVWNAGILTMVGLEVTEPDPLAELRPIKLQAPLGGDCSGQVIVSADAPLTGLAAQCGDLTGPDGAMIPASAVRVRYAESGGAYVQHVNPFDGLLDHPVEMTKLQPVWVTIAVPSGAKPGVYMGTLALSGPTTAKVPVALTVYDWTLADSRQWKSMSSFFQSPENLAKYYKVPLWSDAHFKLIEKSLILQGRLGDRLVHVLAMGAEGSNATLGAESMVLYRREGNKITPDFSLVQRYLKLYKQHVGDPAGVILHVWTIHLEDEFNRKHDRSMMVTFRVGDKLERGTLPSYDDPSIAGLWDEVVAGIKRTMKELDWPESALAFGMSEDRQTGKETTAFFAAHFPDIKWMIISHMDRVATPLKVWGRFAPSGFGDYAANRQGWNSIPARGYPELSLQRSQLDVDSPLTAFRYSPIATLLGGSNGPGGNGLDRWIDRATGCSGLSWGQITRHNPSSVLAPGPDGPVSTVRYEMMRAGFIEAQAMIYVADNAANPKLSAPLASRAKAESQRLCGAISLMDHRAGAVWEAEVDNLYRLAAEIRGALVASH